MANDKVCPEEDELSKFSAGKLPSEQIAKIGEHVESCDECANTLSLLSDKSDTVVTGIREMQQAGQCDEADRQRVVQLAASVRNSDSPEHVTSKPVEIPAELKGMVTDIQQAKLLTQEQINDVIESLSVETRTDAQEFAKALIRSESLTKFQATAIYQRKAKSLVFGEYVVLDKIGAGGMGMVYRAQHRRMKREVAIKVLPGGSLDDEDAVNRFYQEVEAAAKLLHPNIVAAFDAGQHGKSHYLVMEYVEGNDLSELIKSKGPLPVATVVDLIIQTARGLEYAHGEGLVHRDIKPANLLVDKKDTVKILDMGLARFTNTGVTDDGLTKSGQIMGTVDYMAPEQATDTRRADARADIYSLGCTLYRLLTGTPMFEGETIMNKLMAHATETPPDLRVSRPEVSDQLNAAFQKMVAKSPDQRQQSMTEVISDLTSCLSDESMQPAPVPIGQSPAANDTSSDSQLTDFFDGIEPADPPKKVQATAMLEQTIDEQASEVDGTNSQSDLSRAPTPAPTPHKQKSRRGLFIGLTVVGILASLGVMVIYLQGPDGTVRIEILDPKLDVVVNSTGAVIKGDKKFENIKLIPGKDKLKIIRDGFEFFTDDFELKKGEDVVIRVDYVKGKVKVVKNGVALSVNEAKRNPSISSVARTAPPLGIAPFDEKQAKAHQKAWANYLGVAVEKEVELPGGEKMAFMLIPPGEFMMGSTAEEQQQFLKEAKAANVLVALKKIPSEGPQHRVRITRPFYLGKYEVTQPQWNAVMGSNPSEFIAKANPVETVGWHDVGLFLKELNETATTATGAFVLPTEAQWEFACRAGTTTFWHSGDSQDNLRKHAWFGPNSKVHPVGQLRPNGFGLCDMHGNVWEWCNDLYLSDYYALTPLNDPRGPLQGVGHVIRGGCFSQHAIDARSAMRSNAPVDHRWRSVGFRLAMTIDSPKLKVARTPDVTADAPPLAVAPFDEEQAKQHQKAWADYLGVPVEKEVELPGGEKMAFMLIPPGEFMMGSTAEEQQRFMKEAKAANWDFAIGRIPIEGPEHRVRITQAFYLGKYEVTQAQWLSVVGNNPSEFRDNPTHPVDQVSWEDVQSFLARLNGRSQNRTAFALPTEAQWEYACRAGTTTAWHFGDNEALLPEYGWAKSDGKPHPVGQLRPNTFNLHDMHGNVWEWCADFLRSPEGYDAPSLSIDPQGPSTTSRHVIRGGFSGVQAQWLASRSAARDGRFTATRISLLGFRLAMTIDTAKRKNVNLGVPSLQPRQSGNPETVFLSSLTPSKIVVPQVRPGVRGFSTKGQMILGRGDFPLQISGRDKPNSVFMIPMVPRKPLFGSATFRLDGKYAQFYGQVAIPTSAGLTAQEDPYAPVVFEVLGDGVSMWKSKPLAKKNDTQEFRVSVKGVAMLELRVHSESGGWVGSAWIEPQLDLDAMTGDVPSPTPPLAAAPFDEARAKAHQKTWADYLGLPVEKEVALPGGKKMAFMLIPPGEFLMGSSEDEQNRFLKEIEKARNEWDVSRFPSEGPQHRVRIMRPFYLGKYEVMQKQWQAVMENNPSEFKGPKHPVERVSWNDVQPFLTKINATTPEKFGFSLPTEAQWEYACRAGTTTAWPFGDEDDKLRDHCWFGRNSADSPHATGERLPNGFGLYDLHGNVWEWCADRYSPDYYANSPTNDPQGSQTSAGRVFRGGGWRDEPAFCRSATRYHIAPEGRQSHIGFRLAMTIDTTKSPQTNVKNDRVDLLSLIDPKRDGVVGEWSKTKDLVGDADADNDSYMWLQVPYIPPEEYDLNLVVDPGKDGALVVGLVTSHGRFRVAVDRYANGKGKKRHTTFGDPAADWDGRLLKPGEQNDVRFQLRKNGLRIVVNRQQVADWKGDFSAPEFRKIGLYKTPNSRCLVVGGAFDPLHIHSFQLVPVTGTGEQLQPIGKK